MPGVMAVVTMVVARRNRDGLRDGHDHAPPKKTDGGEQEQG